MQFLKLILRNALRHKLRTSLTIAGLIVAILAFGLLQTVVDAWYAGSDAASPDRLITRNAISLTFSMPMHYRDKIRAVNGVRSVTPFNWFGGYYQDPKNFFAQFAIDAKTYLPMIREYVIPADELSAFMRDRKGAIIGHKLALKYGFKIGDTIPLQGTIYPGIWSFTIRAIYEGADSKVDTSQMLFHWDYLNETMKQRTPRRADLVSVFIVQVDDPLRSAEIGQAIDAVFKNSIAETLTETEKAFQLGFIKMTETILIAIRVVSFVVIFIILAVMANTMAMTARERTPEYATLKALGFSPVFVALLILGESLAIAVIGAAAGILLTFPASSWFASQAAVLPVFEVSRSTVLLQVASAVVVGVLAALIPGHRAARVRIVEGLRAIG